MFHIRTKASNLYNDDPYNLRSEDVSSVKNILDVWATRQADIIIGARTIDDCVRTDLIKNIRKCVSDKNYTLILGMEQIRQQYLTYEAVFVSEYIRISTEISDTLNV